MRNDSLFRVLLTQYEYTTRIKSQLKDIVMIQDGRSVRTRKFLNLYNFFPPYSDLAFDGIWPDNGILYRTHMKLLRYHF